MKTELRHWLWPILLAATIFFASSQSSVAGPDVPGIDKVEHGLIYGLLATLLARIPAIGRSRGLGYWLGVVIASLYGITDEFHQSFTPGRSVELADWAADTTGALLAVTVYVCWRMYRAVLEAPLLGRRSTGIQEVATEPQS